MGTSQSFIVVGRLKEVMAQDLARAIAVRTALDPDIQEAYLFGCVLPGMKKPEEVLTLIFPASCDSSKTVAGLSRDLSGVLPPGANLNIWPLTPSESIVGSVRLLGRRLFLRASGGEAIFDEEPLVEKPWWRFW